MTVAPHEAVEAMARARAMTIEAGRKLAADGHLDALARLARAESEMHVETEVELLRMYGEADPVTRERWTM